MIRTENLTKMFITGFMRKKVSALKGLSMHVEKGEVFGFLGPNGAGKTTTLKVLMGLIYPTSGRAWVMGKDISDVSFKGGVGFLPEQPYFYDYLTAAEFMDFYARLFGMGRELRERRSGELLEQVGLSHARGMQLRKFSKGMLQRIGIAQALINDPDLVILDEPMSGLDPIGRKEVRDIILDLKDRGKTIFFSTHILPDVEVICDRVGILVKGELRATGTVGELLGRFETGTVEMSVEGLDAGGRAELEGMSANTVSRDGRVVAFFEDAAKAAKARDMVIRRGGELISLIPHRRSLEDIFVDEVKKQASAGGGAA
jgi:ABC-2 type transport system ATP-binding protein